MKYFLALFLSILSVSGITYTEFYVQTTASNLNSGSTTNDAATYTSVNGNWNGSAIFTPTDGTTPASTVNVGDWASIYIDGATVAVCTARILTVAAGANGAITVSTTAKGGTVPTSSATGRSIKVGGAWKGPTAAVVTIPWAIMNGAMTDVNTNRTRINIKGGVTYSVTTTVVCANNGPMSVRGYTTTPGDGGRATIDGGTTGASFGLAQQTGGFVDWEDLVYAHNGLTASGTGINFNTAVANIYRRVVVASMTGNGASGSGTAINWVECEFYGSVGAGINILGNGILLDRCISHDNSGGGYSMQSTSDAIFLNCIADSNTGIGLSISSGTLRMVTVIGCDFYNNTTHGIDLAGTTASGIYVENCNFVKNGGWGINSPGSLSRSGYVVNCGFGAGTQANTSGNLSLATRTLIEVNSISYASNVTPWSDPANGDFRITLLAAKNVGRGLFLQTQASYTNSLSYPNIGSNQHYAPVSGGSYSFAQ